MTGAAMGAQYCDECDTFMKKKASKKSKASKKRVNAERADDRPQSRPRTDDKQNSTAGTPKRGAGGSSARTGSPHSGW